MSIGVSLSRENFITLFRTDHYTSDKAKISSSGLVSYAVDIFVTSRFRRPSRFVERNGRINAPRHYLIVLGEEFGGRFQ